MNHRVIIIKTAGINPVQVVGIKGEDEGYYTNMMTVANDYFQQFSNKIGQQYEVIEHHYSACGLSLSATALVGERWKETISVHISEAFNLEEALTAK